MPNHEATLKVPGTVTWVVPNDTVGESRVLDAVTPSCDLSSMFQRSGAESDRSRRIVPPGNGSTLSARISREFRSNLIGFFQPSPVPGCDKPQFLQANLGRGR